MSDLFYSVLTYALTVVVTYENIWITYGLPWGRIFPNGVHQKSVKRSDHKGSRDSKVYFILKFCHYTLIHRINRVAIQTLALQPAARRLISNFGIDFVDAHCTHTHKLIRIFTLLYVKWDTYTLTTPKILGCLRTSKFRISKVFAGHSSSHVKKF